MMKNLDKRSFTKNISRYLFLLFFGFVLFVLSIFTIASFAKKTVSFQDYTPISSPQISDQSNDAALNTKWNELKSGLSTYPGFKLSVVTVGSKGYTLTELWNKVSTDDDGSAFKNTALGQLQKLVDNSITWDQIQTALTDANTDLLISLWQDIQDEFQDYKGNVFTDQITVLRTGSTTPRGSFTINELLTEKNNNFNQLSREAIAQLQPLLNRKVANDEVGTALTLRNNNALNAFWKEIQPHLSTYSNLAPDSVIIGTGDAAKTYSIDQLFAQKTHDANSGSTILNSGNPSARSQLQDLVNDEITLLQLNSALNDANNQFLDNKWNELKNDFATYSGFKSDSIEIGSTTYTLTDLWSKSIDPSNPAGSTFDGGAKTQLQALVDDSITWNQIKTELDKLNDDKLDTLWSGLRTALANYAGYIPTTPIDISGNPYTINLLITNKRLRSTDGKDLNTAQGKTQLQTLVNGLIADGALVRSALDNNNKLNNLWTSIKTSLQAYPGSVFSTTIKVFQAGTNTSRGDFTINHLLTEKDDNFANLSTDAITQLQALLNANVISVELLFALVNHNINALNTLWAAIQPYLSVYSNRVPNSISFNNQNYPIDQLFVQKDNTVAGSTLPDVAKNQLQDLFTAGMTTLVQMQTALVDVNTALLTTLWGQIQDEFQNYPGTVFTTQIAVANKGRFTINHLLSEKDDDFTALSDDAKIQLQTLLDNNVADGEVGTALTLRNTNALNALWNAIQPLLSGYSNLAPDSIPFNNQNYNIDQLFGQKTNTNAGSAISSSGNPSARSQLQALVNAGMTTLEQMQTALTNANTTLLSNFWGDIQDALQVYPGNVFSEQIKVLESGTNNSRGDFTINHLLGEKNNNFTDLSPDAITQLQALLNRTVTSSEFKTALDAYWKSLSENTDDSSNQNLAIGLGTAGGVVALAGAGGFAYWFLKIRKS